MIEISISWSGEFKGSETDIVQGLVIDDHAFIGILDQLVDREGGVVWFNDCV